MSADHSISHSVQVDVYGDPSKLHCHTCQRDLTEEEADDYRGVLRPPDGSILWHSLYAARQWARNEVMCDRPVSIVTGGAFNAVMHASYHPSKQAWAWQIYRDHSEWYEDKAWVLREIDECLAVLHHMVGR